jgi:hypothetical protein
MWSRLLLRGMRPYISDGASVLAVERGVADALGPRRRTWAVLTTDALLLGTSVRAKTVLTNIPRADIRAVTPVESSVVDIAFDDYTHAMRRVVRLELDPRRPSSILDQLGPGDPEPGGDA